MTQTFAPYGTLITTIPQLSKTSRSLGLGDSVPGYTSKAQSRTWIDGHFLSVPKYAKYPDWSLEFIPHGVQQAMDAPFRGARQRAAARLGSARSDNDNETRLAAGRSGGYRDRVPNARASGVGRAREISLRSALSEALLGQNI